MIFESIPHSSTQDPLGYVAGLLQGTRYQSEGSMPATLKPKSWDTGTCKPGASSKAEDSAYCLHCSSFFWFSQFDIKDPKR